MNDNNRPFLSFPGQLPSPWHNSPPNPPKPPLCLLSILTVHTLHHYTSPPATPRFNHSIILGPRRPSARRRAPQARGRSGRCPPRSSRATPSRRWRGRPVVVVFWCVRWWERGVDAYQFVIPALNYVGVPLSFHRLYAGNKPSQNTRTGSALPPVASKAKPGIMSTSSLISPSSNACASSLPFPARAFTYFLGGIRFRSLCTWVSIIRVYTHYYCCLSVFDDNTRPPNHLPTHAYLYTPTHTYKYVNNIYIHTYIYIYTSHTCLEEHEHAGLGQIPGGEPRQMLHRRLLHRLALPGVVCLCHD